MTEQCSRLVGCVNDLTEQTGVDTYMGYRHVGMPHMMVTFGTIEAGIISVYMAPRE